MTTRSHAPALALALAVASLVPPSARAAPRPITLEEAVALALKQNLDLRVSDLQERAADEDARSTRGNLLPKFKADANLFFYDSPFDTSIPITIPGAPPGFMAPTLRIRQERTDAAGLAASQPVTALYSISKRWRAQQELADAARADGQTLRAELAFRTTEAYLRLLQAMEIRRVAQETITDIEEQARIAKALVSAGTLIPADELRTEVQLAQSRQDLLRTDAQVEQARGALAVTVGLPVETQLEPARIDPNAMPRLPASPDEPLGDAQRRRPELRAASLRANAAESVRKATWADMLPQINLQAEYQHVDGYIELFQKPDVFYTAGFLNWNFWEWGTQFYASEAARARALAADADVERRRRDVSLEVYRRFLDARAAFAAIEVARTAVQQAIEARRVTKALYENGSATTTDLLTAELSLESARVNDARSTYEALIAYAALSRAAGSAAQLPRAAAPAEQEAPIAVPPPPVDKTPITD